MQEKETFYAYLTKYALSAGIEHKKVERSTVAPNLVTVVGNIFSAYHGEGKDWHRTREAAVKRAESMRAAKIASLSKQIMKIKNLKFE